MLSRIKIKNRCQLFLKYFMLQFESFIRQKQDMQDVQLNANDKNWINSLHKIEHLIVIWK